jgi:hypothetical protein
MLQFDPQFQGYWCNLVPCLPPGVLHFLNFSWPGQNFLQVRSNPVSRVSSNTSVKDKVNSASRLNKGNDYATSKGRQSRQNSGDFKRSTEWIHEKEIRRSREPCWII